MTKGTILVVDADAAIRNLVQLALSDEGYTVCLSRERVTLDHRQARQADLILLDVPPAEASGRAMADRLRADPATARIPLVGFSTRADGVALAARLRLDALLAKPFDLDALSALVACWVVEGRHRRPRAALC